jgi:predicted nucleic acid-binding protein
MIVADASVWVSILLEADLFHSQSYSWFEEYSRFSGEVAAPTLLLPEVAAGITRRTDDATTGYAAMQRLVALPQIHIVPVDEYLALVAAELAANYHLRGADAVYAALAYSLNVPLVTWDQEQMMRVRNVVKTGAPGTAFGTNGQSTTPP